MATSHICLGLTRLRRLLLRRPHEPGGPRVVRDREQGCSGWGITCSHLSTHRRFNPKNCLSKVCCLKLEKMRSTFGNGKVEVPVCGLTSESKDMIMILTLIDCFSDFLVQQTRTSCITVYFWVVALKQLSLFHKPWAQTTCLDSYHLLANLQIIPWDTDLEHVSNLQISPLL